MMRWLKEKKREKRSSSVGGEDEGLEDDYGFEREKAVSKSPLTKRQLPPTPLTPEEKSPHIYEEIHDGIVVPSSPQKLKRHKPGAAGGSVSSSNNGGTSSVASSGVSSKTAGTGKEDPINPYMVVPVDEEVRQTPTNFHRNGTPEVHCDVIVKDTHCEILLSRKPKVSAFRMDDAAKVSLGSESSCNNSTGGNPAIRNNTHFCSQNRRASVDVHGPTCGRYGSSSGAWNSSAFSSSSTSRVNSMAASMMSLTTLSERHSAPDDGSGSGSSAKGIMTYTGASNFIPRPTKLTFNPLKPNDGDDTSLSNQDPFFSMMPPCTDPPFSEAIFGNTTCSSAHNNSDVPVVYSSIPNPNPDLDLNHNLNNFPLPNSSQPHVRTHLEPNPNPNPNSFNDPSPSCKPHRNYSTDKAFQPLIRADSPSNVSTCTYTSVSFPLIRADSPSNVSTCTYTSVSFPAAEVKVYNTIAPDLISQETTRQLQSHTAMRHLESSVELESDAESIRYSSIQDTPFRSSATTSCLPGHCGKVQYVADDSVYAGVLPYRINGNLNQSGFCDGTRAFSASLQPNTSGGNMSQTGIANGQLCVNALSHGDANSATIYCGILGEGDVNTNTTVYACIDTNTDIDIDQSNLLDNMNNNNTNIIVKSSNSNIDTSEADVDRILYGQVASNLILDFCTCSDDQHSSVCGYIDTKQDDDTSSIATTINEARSSCTGCGRLIRQITYSESYSDETYEHVYSSRLLLRKGRRRFSSPDITMSEMSTSESNHGCDDVKNHETAGLISRDDSWTTKNDDVSSSFYRPTHCVVKDDSNLFPNIGESQGNDSVESTYCTDSKSGFRVALCQSFSNFGSSLINKNNAAPGREAVVIDSLAQHCVSLPATIPPNLVPVFDNSSSPSQPPPQPKSTTFSSILSKFSRPKSKHNNTTKTETTQMESVTNAKSNVKPGDSSSNPNANYIPANQDSAIVVDQIPERNTSKLSKFFQRLSVTDPQGSEVVKTREKKREEDSGMKSLRQEGLENSSGANVPKILRFPKEATPADANTLDTKLDKSRHYHQQHHHHHHHQQQQQHKDVSSLKNVISSPSGGVKDSLRSRSEGTSHLDPQADRNHPQNRVPTTSAPQSKDPGVDNVSSTAGGNGLDLEAGGMEPNATQKSPNKTDSGDTCYEYDISTSSEGEQTSYDYFLSKVKKSLNLEQEVQQIADMTALRRKSLCKKCKRNDGCGAGENEDCESVGSDGGCPHLSMSKYGDLRKIFGDFVVDQRAAILDCLTDYAHGPFNVKGEGRESMCRGCGCEIITSDSESMTTVYSIFSQQFRMTSPGTHTPSCDSDDGTMADNSCESADEEDNDVSSGYDEAIGPAVDHVTQRTKRKEKCRERKERKLHHSNVFHKEQDKLKKKMTSQGQQFYKRDEREVNITDHRCPRGQDRNQTMNKIEPSDDRLSHSSMSVGTDGSKDRLSHSSMSVGTVGKNSLKTEVKSEERVSSDVFTHCNNKYRQVYDHQKHEETSGTKSRPRLLPSDKVIQDIYAPLPSKALSWLTARHCDSRSAVSCSCVRPPQSSTSLLIQSGELEGSGKEVTQTAPGDSACVRRVGAMTDVSYHHSDVNSEKGLNPGLTHRSYSHCEDGTDPSGEEKNNKTAQSRSGHVSGDKLFTSVNDGDRLGYKSSLSCFEFECPPERTGIVVDLSCPPSENVLHNSEKCPPYSKYVADSQTGCQGSNIKLSSLVTARMELTGPEMVSDSGLALQDRVKQETKAETTQAHSTSCADVNHGKRTDVSSRQKQKQLQMAALDFLPETVLGSDADMGDCRQQEVKAIALHTHSAKSNIVERLAKMFEDNNPCSTATTRDGMTPSSCESKEISHTIASSTTKAMATNVNKQKESHGFESKGKSTTPALSTMVDTTSTTNTTQGSTSCNPTTLSTTPPTSRKEKLTVVTNNNNNTSIVKSYVHSSSSSYVHSISSSYVHSSSSSYIHSSSSSYIHSSSSSSSPSNYTPTTTSASAGSATQGSKNSGFTHEASSSVKGHLHPNPTDHPPLNHSRSLLPQDKSSADGTKSVDLNIGPGLSDSLKDGAGSAPRSKSEIKRASRREAGIGTVAKEAGSGSGVTRTSKEIRKDERRNESSRPWKQLVSPSPSSSSGSSSKRKVAGGQGRQKKLSKRGHLHKRARSKSERRKSHREERTRYYFSSDLSDIDVVEVDDWETYSSSRSHDNSGALKSSHDISGTGGKPEVNDRRRRFEKEAKSKPSADSSFGIELGEECGVIQEIYSIPPNSSELRGAASSLAEDGKPSPQMSPEVGKMTKTRKTDIYKTKKNNNQLLSDLIIRNYDRQMYEVGNGNV